MYYDTDDFASDLIFSLADKYQEQLDFEKETREQEKEKRLLDITLNFKHS